MTTSSSHSQPCLPPDSGAVAAFFYTAAKSLHMGYDDPFMGADDNGMLTPPAWSFSDNAQEADALLALVLSGKKTLMSSALNSYPSREELPEPGLSIICDSKGLPKGLIRTVSVQVVPFAEVSAEQACREGEGDLSLDFWRESHREAYACGNVVLEEFTLVHPRVEN